MTNNLMEEPNIGCGCTDTHQLKTHGILARTFLDTSSLVITTANGAHKDQRDDKDAVARTMKLGELQPCTAQCRNFPPQGQYHYICEEPPRRHDRILYEN